MKKSINNSLIFFTTFLYIHSTSCKHTLNSPQLTPIINNLIPTSISILPTSPTQLIIFGYLNQTLITDKYSVIIQTIEIASTISILQLESHYQGDGPAQGKQCVQYDSQGGRMFVYGQEYGELWVRNGVGHGGNNGYWQRVRDDGPNVRECSLEIYNGKLYLIGLSVIQSILQVYTIQFLTITSSSWSNMPLTFCHTEQKLVKLWDNTQQITFTPPSHTQCNQISTQISLKTNSLCTTSHKTLSTTNPSILILSSNKIYNLNLYTANIITITKHYLSLQDNSKIDCQYYYQTNNNQGSTSSQEQWLFVIDYQKEYVKYFKVNQWEVTGIIDIGGMGDMYDIWIQGGDLYFMKGDFVKIEKDCEYLLTVQMQNNISNIQKCFYDKLLCKQGTRGTYCQQNQCPNTLYLTDLYSSTQILFQCSNNGQCISGQCICSQFWTGNDCSIYSRKQCYGQLVYNWPILNCQCLEETSGGNSCQVVFCYNDCTLHGICLSDGLCQCYSGYFGEDCSVVIIDFPGVSEIQ